jgi:hypothetical protein
VKDNVAPASSVEESKRSIGVEVIDDQIVMGIEGGMEAAARTLGLRPCFSGKCDIASIFFVS